jgi:hypothetical protein
MRLGVGARVGPYQAASLLGVGVMGEVYRVRDTKLNRDEALKVQPDDFALDPDRVARFELEAQLLGAPTPLYDADLDSGLQLLGPRRQYDVAQDGRFLLSVAVAGEVTLPTTLLNWAELHTQH